jgi:hypothetical protein
LLDARDRPAATPAISIALASFPVPVCCGKLGEDFPEAGTISGLQHAVR